MSRNARDLPEKGCGLCGKPFKPRTLAQKYCGDWKDKSGCAGRSHVLKLRKDRKYKEKHCSLCKKNMGYVRGPQGLMRGCDDCKRAHPRWFRAAGPFHPSWLQGKEGKWWHSTSAEERLAYFHRNSPRTSAQACEWCGSEEILQVDHCHDTHEVRGILCFRCNLVEGNLMGCIRDHMMSLGFVKDYMERIK